MISDMLSATVSPTVLWAFTVSMIPKFFISNVSEVPPTFYSHGSKASQVCDA